MKTAEQRRLGGLQRKARLASLIVTFERLYDAAAPALGVLLLFAIVSLFGLWHLLPPWLHVVGLLAFAAAFAFVVWGSRARFRLAAPAEALARLEQDSGIRHQGLRALEDRLPNEVSDATTHAIWNAYRRRLLDSINRLRVSPPRSALPQRDPWAVRAALMLLLCVALVDARGDLGGRLLGAFRPAFGAGAPAPQVVAHLWVTPPAYTGRAPLGIEQTSTTDHLIVPHGSEALAQLHHLPDSDGRMPRLEAGAGTAEFNDLGGGSAEVRATLETPGRLRILGPDGASFGDWALEVLPDQPPEVAFVGEPEATHRGALRIDYEAHDDYGVAEIALELAPRGRAHEAEKLSLAKPSRAPGKFASSGYADLTAHPLAGLPVTLRLEALDSIGQSGSSGELEVVLPERTFRHPLARAIIEQRKRLSADPEAKDEIAARLGVLAHADAAQEFGIGVPLSLMIAASRTRGMTGLEDRRSVASLLWEVALFVEDGNLSETERTLRALQEELQRALLEGATDQKLERLMNELQEALDRFLEELTRRALAEAQQMPPDQQQFSQVDPSQLVDRQDLQRMLDRARELMRSGARDAAQQMLSQLRDMLENLQAAIGRPQQSPQQRALSDLQRMIQLQQNLLDRSFQMQQQGMQGQQQPGMQGQQQPGMEGGQGQPENALPDSPGRAATEQEGLRRALGELMRRMGENGMPIPRALGQAEMQMRGARDSLQQGQPGEAAPSQSQALDLMQQGGQAMLEQLQQQYGQQPGEGPGQEPMAQGRRGRDPLGRAMYNDGGYDPNGTLVPEEADLGRARDVLEELYRRSGDRRRSPAELDYYRRLLDRF
jgi:uncharacterized protein (TIGR02302 family)